MVVGGGARKRTCSSSECHFLEKVIMRFFFLLRTHRIIISYTSGFVEYLTLLLKNSRNKWGPQLIYENHLENDSDCWHLARVKGENMKILLHFPNSLFKKWCQGFFRSFFFFLNKHRIVQRALSLLLWSFKMSVSQTPRFT